MAAVTVVSCFLVEVPLVEYFDWITILFWVAFGISLAFGAIFLLSLKNWVAGLTAGISITTLMVITIVDLLIFGKFPLLPGASINLISLISFASLGAIGIIAGKTASDKKNGYCIPFFEDCTKYECEKIGKCKKL